jgi:hypothetical protein
VAVDQFFAEIEALPDVEAKGQTARP